MNKHNVPDLKLEQYLLGELDASEIADITVQCSQDDHLNNQLASLRKMEKEFSEKYPIDWFQRRISQKNILTNRPKSSFGLILVPIVCTLILLPVAYFYISMSMNLNSSETRLKGDNFYFIVYRKTTLGHDLLPDGSVVKHKDLLQVEYTADTTLLYGLLLSIDGNNHITIHLGNEDGSSVKLTEKHKMLPYSYELDDAPGFEKFFFVTGKYRFTLNDCILLCKKMEKHSCKTTKFSIKMLTLNKVSILE